MSYIVPRDIPKNCRECPCGYITEGAFSDECRALAREWEKNADSVRPNRCPLIEIKTPHGRLIDADMIEYENWYLEETGETYKMVGKDDIDGMLVVIEAEGETE